MFIKFFKYYWDLLFVTRNSVQCCGQTSHTVYNRSILVKYSQAEIVYQCKVIFGQILKFIEIWLSFILFCLSNDEMDLYLWTIQNLKSRIHTNNRYLVIKVYLCTQDISFIYNRLVNDACIKQIKGQTKYNATEYGEDKFKCR